MLNCFIIFSNSFCDPCMLRFDWVSGVEVGPSQFTSKNGCRGCAVLALCSNTLLGAALLVSHVG